MKTYLFVIMWLPIVGMLVERKYNYYGESADKMVAFQERRKMLIGFWWLMYQYLSCVALGSGVLVSFLPSP